MAISVFIGTEDSQWLPTEILKHSILRRSSAQYHFTELKNIPLKLDIKMYTGFSFYRFSIPDACKFSGRAIYLDADIIVLCDLQELYDKEMQGHGVLARSHSFPGYYTSVMLMDCSKLKHWKIREWTTLINARIASYAGTMNGDASGLGYKDYGPLAKYWNELDEWDSFTKILHYTHVPSQPWKVPGHPLGGHFLREMQSALDQQFITAGDVEREIQLGHVYPTILEDIALLKKSRADSD